MLMDGGGIAPTPYLRRTKELTAGRMASIFQWSNRSATIEIECAPATGGTSEIRARGADLECAFAVSAGGVRLLALRG
jgi:hypothetical protein